MAKTSFDDFVARQRATSSETAEIDWDKQRDEWLRYLDKLYATIEDYLTSYLKSGQIIRSYRDIILNEENIGTYTARELVLKIGPQEINFRPIGTLFIGSKGRVDVRGPVGSATLLLVNSRADGVRSLIHVTVQVVGRKPPPSPQRSPTEITWEWKIFGGPPDGRFLPLTRDSLFEIIMEIANG